MQVVCKDVIRMPQVALGIYQRQPCTGKRKLLKVFINRQQINCEATCRGC
jgi:hypothetical protein